jgi:spore coat protein A
LVKVTWVNDLRDERGDLRKDHLLPVDHCVHGVHDDIPHTVVHLHGAHVPSEYDGQPEQTLRPGQEATYEYPNHQEAATLWYHDHAMGITRLNVYMGLSGLYLLRDPREDALPLPSGEYEIPLVIQDRSVRADGRLVYPDKYQDHFFGDNAVVNGKISPYLDVKRGMYRFRVLNGSNSRTYTLSLSKQLPMSVIGSDGGLLPKPVELTTLTLSPAERVELVIDFSKHLPGEVVYLSNRARTPYPNGTFDHPLPQIMQFRVGTEAGHTTPLPTFLRSKRELPEASAQVTRDFVLANEPNDCGGSVWLINGKTFDEITERPVLGTREIWRFVNSTHMTHPMHMHLVMFQVLDRQGIEMHHDETVLAGTRLPPRPEESGWKDTVQVGPMEMVRVIAEFTDYAGRFPYHCHILEHEDQAMMRQFETVAPEGQRDAGTGELHDTDGGDHDGGEGPPTKPPRDQAGCGCSMLAGPSQLGLSWLSCCAAWALWRSRRRRARQGSR